jgi:hypothetical protein
MTYNSDRLDAMEKEWVRDILIEFFPLDSSSTNGTIMEVFAGVGRLMLEYYAHF